MSDSEIQDRLQRGELVSGPAGSAYQKVFNALSREPQFVLPPSFADRVMLRLIAPPTKSRDMLWFSAGLAACFVALSAAIWLSGVTVNINIPHAIKDSSGFILLGMLLIVALHLLDRRLVRKMT